MNNGKEVAASQLLADNAKQNALHLASFTVSNTSRTKATVEVKGLKQYRLFVDGEQVKVNGDKAETVLLPSTHTVVIKYLTASDSSSDKTADKDAAKDFKVSVTAADGKQLSVGGLLPIPSAPLIYMM